MCMHKYVCVYMYVCICMYASARMHVYVCIVGMRTDTYVRMGMLFVRRHIAGVKGMTNECGYVHASLRVLILECGYLDA